MKSGKVRELYDAGENLILVASDRVSAFDVILPTTIPEKGKILSTLSVFWFARTAHIVDNHLLLHRVEDFPDPWAEIAGANDWDGRALLCRKAQVVPIECVVRGYISGSAWKQYQKTGFAGGIELPEGLRESEKLSAPIFTPTTKTEDGHDEPLSWEECQLLIGEKTARHLRDVSLALYEWIAAYSLLRGLILADTKFEFGVCDGEILVVDEMATPDSSRFWDVETYAPGRAQESFDKQFVRDFLETQDWDKTPPGPQLPAEVVEGTRSRYIEAYNRLTGLEWPDSDVRAR